MAAQSEVIVAVMKSVSEELKMKRPGICRPNSVPSLSFGYGVTPSKKDTRTLLLAIAWDSLIQLVSFDETKLEVTQDGVYYTDFVIDHIQFVADSTLMAWSNKDNIKLIDTKGLKPGDYKQLES